MSFMNVISELRNVLNEMILYNWKIVIVIFLHKEFGVFKK